MLNVRSLPIAQTFITFLETRSKCFKNPTLLSIYGFASAVEAIDVKSFCQNCNNLEVHGRSNAGPELFL